MSSKTSKRIRAKGDENTSLPICYIARIPFELIAEILFHTSFPSDILALARSSKYFFSTLVSNPSSQFIWRTVRANAKPEPIPDPVPWLSEAVYAAIIFDKGVCEICKCPSKDMYTSFALKARLCSKSTCKRAFRMKFEPQSSHQAFKSWLPLLETPHCLDESLSLEPSAESGLSVRFRRSSDWRDEMEHFSKASRSAETHEEYLAARAIMKDRLPAYQLMCFNLYCWKLKWDAARTQVRQLNIAITNQVAHAQGWNRIDLANSSSYKALRQQKLASLEEISDRDIKAIYSQAEAELIGIQKRRANRKQEHALKEYRDKIEECYNKLKNEVSGTEVFPVLSEFRKFTIAEAFQAKSATVVSSDMPLSFVSKLLQDDLAKWRVKVQDEFAKKLGYSNWQTPSTHKIHPAYRLSSIFTCTKCSKLPKKTSIMWFNHACLHQCPQGNQKERAKQGWDIAQFAPLNVARKAVERFASLEEIDLELVSSLQSQALTKSRILCLSCSAPIVMDFRRMIRHSTRHDDMDMAILTEAQMAEIVKRPVEYGLTQTILTGSREVQAAVVYQCRHCHQTLKKSEDPVWITENRPKKRLMSFHGLRCHLREKHGVVTIGDEDFYRMPVGEKQQEAEEKYHT